MKHTLKSKPKKKSKKALSSVRRWLDETYSDHNLIVADGFDDALVGTVTRFGMDPVPLYNYHRCIEILVKCDKMTMEDAVEHFEFNVIGAWVGDGTPAFATFPPKAASKS